AFLAGDEGCSESGTETVAPSGVRLPSKLTAGDSPTASANRPILPARSDHRMTRLGRAALSRRENPGYRLTHPGYAKRSAEKKRNRVADCQHFSHPGAALRPLVADHEHFAFPVFLVLDRPETRFLPVKARRLGKFQVRHPSNLNNCTKRREVALGPDDTADDGE